MKKKSAAAIERWVPIGLVLFFIAWLALGFVPPHYDTSFEIAGFGKLPILSGGRIKPIDTLARTALLVLSGKQTVKPDAALGAADGRPLAALQWLLEVLFKPAQANGYPVFEIDNPDVLGLMSIQQTARRRFSFTELQPHLTEIGAQAVQIEQIKSEQRSRFQTALMNLANQLDLYEKLQNTLEVSGTPSSTQVLQNFDDDLAAAVKAHRDNPVGLRKKVQPLLDDMERFKFIDQSSEFFALPPSFRLSRAGEWLTIGSAVLGRLQGAPFHPGVLAYAGMGDAWRAQDPLIFNQALQSYGAWLQMMAPRDLAHARAEYIFNYFEPFYRSLVIYLVVFLLVFTSWMVWPKTLNRTAFYLLVLAFLVHTGGLLSRMVLQGRPPVTNLYSSAIFVGWVAVLLGIVLERLYRNGIGSMVSSVIGFMTLIIAHHLASSGDTLEMMRAVLDSNFWLATHVVCITVGYGSTFLSGFLAILFILRERIDPQWKESSAASLERMVYGVVCFATFFSFLGTILGGIWADQSWGRFWGWDPKENGALMIVLWNVLILHARLGGLVKRRGIMLMAVFGNIVTALSWFGVNMLGIGLHSYGFMEKAFVWLLLFAVSQLLLIGIGFYPPPKVEHAKE